jgi:hypothetical protein
VEAAGAEAVTEIIFAPVIDKAGDVVLYDMHIAGRWHGSRRTQAQCIEYVTQEVPNGYIRRASDFARAPRPDESIVLAE